MQLFLTVKVYNLSWTLRLHELSAQNFLLWQLTLPIGKVTEPLDYAELWTVTLASSVLSFPPWALHLEAGSVLTPSNQDRLSTLWMGVRKRVADGRRKLLTSELQSPEVHLCSHSERRVGSWPTSCEPQTGIWAGKEASSLRCARGGSKPQALFVPPRFSRFSE